MVKIQELTIANQIITGDFSFENDSEDVVTVTLCLRLVY